MNGLFALGSIFFEKPPCPICDEDFTDEQPIHCECLKKRWGDPLPDDIERLIEEFELDKPIPAIDID